MGYVKIWNKYGVCKKSQGRISVGPEQPDLPKFRLDFNYAFSNTGGSFVDPLFVKNIYGSSDKTFKAYVCLFTCATTRNVHLELRPSLKVDNVVIIKCYC